MIDTALSIALGKALWQLMTTTGADRTGPPDVEFEDAAVVIDGFFVDLPMDVVDQLRTAYWDWEVE